MKKIINFVIVLGMLFLIFQFGINLFKSHHYIDYKLKIGNKQISINEEYIKKDKDDYYLFKVIIDDNVFVFDVDNKFNKQKKVIEDFRMYEEEDLFCISPLYIKNNEESIVVCNVDKKQTSYTSVKDNNNLEDFLNSLENFNFSKYDSFDNNSIIGKSLVYKGNMYEDEQLVIYDYKDLIKITKKTTDRIRFSNYDVYDNEFGILIDKYYILPIYTNKPEYSGLSIINIETEAQERMIFDDEISTNIYINGVVNNKLYFFDKSNLIQYEVDPEKDNYRIVGNKSTNGQYYDGKWSTRNIYDFYRNNMKFTMIYPIKDDYVSAFETSKYYYYYNSNNEFYKVYKQQLDNPIFLFQYDDMEEVKVMNDCIYFINSDTLYRYDDSGLKKLVTNNEFKYNYENIYGVYFR